ncbi:MAG: DUF1104 domain-containing protein [Sulfurovaceae bacterium]|nr:DUF1104 domain-containing protein [Sulfurovaceae bacterium]
MKKVMMIAALACAAWAADYSHMSTEQLMNMRGNVSTNECPSFHQEMQKRMQRMSPQERQHYMNSGYGMGMGGNSMMKMMSFNDFDINHNGFITKFEFQKGQEKCRARMQKMRGYNGQGMMGRNYMKPMMTFRDFDINHNGFITKFEFQKGHEKCMARMQKMQNNCGYNNQGMMRGNPMMNNNNMGGGMNSTGGRMMNNNTGGMMNNSGSGRTYNNTGIDRNRTMPPK